VNSHYNKGVDRKPIRAKWIGIAVAAGLFLFYVWPTPWVYGSQNNTMVRVNRFTGTVQFPDQEFGWNSQEDLIAAHRKKGEEEFAKELDQIGNVARKGWVQEAAWQGTGLMVKFDRKAGMGTEPRFYFRETSDRVFEVLRKSKIHVSGLKPEG